MCLIMPKAEEIQPTSWRRMVKKKCLLRISFASAGKNISHVLEESERNIERATRIQKEDLAEVGIFANLLNM